MVAPPRPSGPLTGYPAGKGGPAPSRLPAPTERQYPQGVLTCPIGPHYKGP